MPSDSTANPVKVLLCMAMILAGASSDSHAYFPDCVRYAMVYDVDIKDATFDEAIQYLRMKSGQVEMDHIPVNVVIKPPLSTVASSARITLQIKEAKIADAFAMLGKFTRMHVRTEPHAFVFSAKP